MKKIKITKQHSSKKRGYIMDSNDFAICNICGKKFQGYKGHRDKDTGKKDGRGRTANHLLKQHLISTKHFITISYEEYIKLKKG